MKENVVTVDYLTLEAGTYRFTTSETESLHQRPLGTVTQESIPASGKAYMRRQTIELDGHDVTLQTYALPGSNGGGDELRPPARYCVSLKRYERAVRRGLGRQCHYRTG